MDSIKLLIKLGLTEYEARAYSSLVKLGASTVREIVLESKLPRNKAYEALQKLEEKNKVLSLPVTPKKYKISDPEAFRVEVQDLTKAVNELIKQVERPKVTEFKDLVWLIKGQKAVQEKLLLTNTKVKKEILGCNVLSKILYKHIRMMKEAVKRGVNVKIICKYDPDKNRVYSAWLKTGAEIRVFNEKIFGPLLPRISIFDGEIARLTIGAPEVKRKEDYITFWTESKAFAQMLRNHFLNMWKESKPIQEYLQNRL